MQPTWDWNKIYKLKTNLNTINEHDNISATSSLTSKFAPINKLPHLYKSNDPHNTKFPNSQNPKPQITLTSNLLFHSLQNTPLKNKYF